MAKLIVTTCDRCGSSTTATTQGDYLWIVMPDSAQRDVCPECAESFWEWWADLATADPHEFVPNGEGNPCLTCGQWRHNPPHLESRERTS